MVIPSPSFLSGATSCCQYTYFFRGTSSYLLLQISSELQEYLDCAYKMSENKLPKAHFNLKKLPNTQLYSDSVFQILSNSSPILQLRENSTIPNVYLLCDSHLLFPDFILQFQAWVEGGLSRECRWVFHVSTEF